MNTVSIFNDVIGPVMRGPSSSHCAAALRIGRLARDLMDGEITDVLVEFDRAGSLPTTHESQGSDMGLFGGLLGWEADDERLPESAKALAAAGIKLRIETIDVGDPHPNTYRLTLKNSRETHSLIAISTGGGMMEVLSIDSVELHMDGGYHEMLIWAPKGAVAKFEADEVIVHNLGDTQLIQVKSDRFVGSDVSLATKRLSPVLPVPSRKNLRVPFASCADMLKHDGGQNTPLWQLALEYERARGNFTESVSHRQDDRHRAHSAQIHRQRHRRHEL
jgi:L-serine dehydratase